MNAITDKVGSAERNAFEEHFQSSWEDPTMSSERKTWSAAWAAREQTHPTAQEAEPAVLPIAAKTHGAWDGLELLDELPDGTELYAHPPRPQADAGAAPAVDREKLIDAIADGLRGTWHCTRVWEAWHIGTMSQDDFVPVDESETPSEIADAVLSMLAAPQAPAAAETLRPGIDAAAKMLTKKAEDFAAEHGHDDMGGLSFGQGAHAEAKLDWHSSLLELAEEVRALLTSRCNRPPAGWACSRAPGHEGPCAATPAPAAATAPSEGEKRHG